MRTTDGNRIVRFAERFGRYTRGSLAGKPIVLRDWQKELLIDLAASRARNAYIQMPRKNGKSMLGAILALYNLCADGEQGADVFSVAGAHKQARIVFEEAVKMVRLGPLGKVLTVYEGQSRSEIIDPKSGSRYRALAADAGTLEGLNPHCVIFDELHVLGSDRRLWDVMNLGIDTREAPLVLALTTPGVRWGADGQESFALQQYEYVKRLESGELKDSAFFGRIWEAPADCELRDEAAWHIANPGLGDFLDLEGMRQASETTEENEFRTKRLGQWVESQHAWLPVGKWEDCATEDRPEDGQSIILGFDGSRTRDATALIGATIEPNPLVFVVNIWERPKMATHNWAMPRDEINNAIRTACKRWKVKEVNCDKAFWETDLQILKGEGLPIIDVDQRSRMVAAAQKFYEAVMTQSMRQDGNPVLARHVGNVVLKPTGHIGKEHKDSGRKVDGAVAAVMAFNRAALFGNYKTKPMFIKYA